MTDKDESNIEMFYDNPVNKNDIPQEGNERFNKGDFSNEEFEKTAYGLKE